MCSAGLLHSAVAEPVDVNDKEQDADCPHELHDFSKPPKVVFMLHGSKRLGRAKIVLEVSDGADLGAMSSVGIQGHSLALNEKGCSDGSPSKKVDSIAGSSGRVHFSFCRGSQ